MNCSSMAVLYISDMLITFAIFGACCISVIKTHAGHSHNSEANEEILEEEWPSEEEKMDHLVNLLDIVSFLMLLPSVLRFLVVRPTSLIT